MLSDHTVGENWNEIVYNGIKVTNYGASVYFVCVFIVGDMVVLNLFLAVILLSFDDGELLSAYDLAHCLLR